MLLENLIIEKKLIPYDLPDYKLPSTVILDPREFTGTTTAQLAAKKAVIELWQIAKISTYEPVRCINKNIADYDNIEINEKNQYLFITAAMDAINGLQSKLLDLKSPQVKTFVVRFDGTINNKTGTFLIEFPLDSTPEYVNNVRGMKAININEKISLTHLLNFYANHSLSPFIEFDLKKYRYIYLPIEEERCETAV